MALNYVLMGGRIKSARKHRGLSQAQLSEMVEISASYISYLESGTKGISLEKFVEIANALNATADQLLIDSLQNTVKVSNHEFTALLNDCSEYEKQVLFEILQSSKETLRKNKRYLGTRF